jgi:hypothetical protein
MQLPQRCVVVATEVLLVGAYVSTWEEWDAPYVGLGGDPREGRRVYQCSFVACTGRCCVNRGCASVRAQPRQRGLTPQICTLVQACVLFLCVCVMLDCMLQHVEHVMSGDLAEGYPSTATGGTHQLCQLAGDATVCKPIHSFMPPCVGGPLQWISGVLQSQAAVYWALCKRWPCSCWCVLPVPATVQAGPCWCRCCPCSVHMGSLRGQEQPPQQQAKPYCQSVATAGIRQAGAFAAARDVATMLQWAGGPYSWVPACQVQACAHKQCLV